MSDKAPLATKDDVATQSTQPTPNPVSVKSWLQKLLVMALCAMSFFAGWKAHQSQMIDQCLDSGGQIQNIDGVYYCER